MLLFCMICALAGSARADEVAVKWQPTVKAAVNLAQREERPLLVYVTSVHCTYCRKLERTTWADPKVMRALDADFVSIKLDAAKHQKFVDRMGISAYPTTLLLTPDGDLIRRIEGYVPPQDMLKHLQISKPASPTK
ncbi:MAG: thioredoxin family protein [Planctomycetes bacterium]|nr:thioredoxin family protein [Planctomycetota bacterium]